MNDVYVLGGLRSFLGVQNKMYRKLPAEMLGAEVLKKVIERYLPAKARDEIDMIFGGNVVGGGGNITRLMMLEAGLPQQIPAISVDLQCGSGLECIALAAANIASGQMDLVIAGGFESSSTQPGSILNRNHPDYESDQKIYTVAKFIPHRHGEQVMPEGAEYTAREHQILRMDMDPWVLKSHQRAAAARDHHVLDDIIVSIAGSNQDEGIKDRMSQKLLDKLPPLLANGSRITAGHSCQMNDGAAFVVLCSKRYLNRHGGVPKARIHGTVSIGGDPYQSPATAILAIKQLIKKYDTDLDAIRCFEVNEAFAVIDCLFERAFPGSVNRLNLFGGALAYGHPYGASGAIIFLHLLRALEETNGKLGVCSIAAAGGIGTAMLIGRE